MHASIGKYEIQKLLGKGATGSVYLASDAFAGREVAIKVLDAMPTHEEPENAYGMIRRILEGNGDIVGLFISGGGISGVTRAMRELPAERRREFRIVCRDIGPETRTGLTEGLITAALCHPMDPMADALVEVMVESLGDAPPSAIVQRSVPFLIVTPENV